MEQMLNEEMPQSSEKDRKYGIWFTYSIAASLLLIFVSTFVSFYIMNATSKHSSSYALQYNKKIEPISEAQYGYPFSYGNKEENTHTLPIYTENRKREKHIKQKNTGEHSQTNLKQEEVNMKFTNSLPKPLSEKYILQENKPKGNVQVLDKSIDQRSQADFKNQALLTKENVTAKQAIHLNNKEENASESILKNKMATNEKRQKIQIISSVDMRKAFVKDKVNLGLQTNGSIGFVSKGTNNYGVRLGLEFSKNLNPNLAVNSGVRYSAYKEAYKSTYRLGDEANYAHYQLITDLSNRKVNRRFVEFPAYIDYSLTDVIKLKAGGLLTYNKNNSSKIGHSALSIANNYNITDDVKLQAGKLMQDKHGYLGEAVIGTTIDLNKISLDVEGNYGLISNQAIDNRSILGIRLNYKFGR